MRRHTKIARFEAAPGDPFRPTATPIYQTATFEQESALEFGAYDYTRSGNPTRAALESALADLEGGGRAFAFASGMAAITAVTRLLAPGDEILANEDLYGGAHRLFSRVLAERGVGVRYADLTDLKAAERAVGERTRLIHTESLTNPRLRVCDVRGLAGVARRRGCMLCVDATALSPYLQRPLDLGADVVVHSATKHLGGHGDVTAGALATRDDAIAERIAFIQNAEGAALGPFDAFLLLRGMRTLAVRLDRQQATAQRVAEWLARDGRVWGVRDVRFPGLPGHPGGAVHARQADGPGTLVCFETGSIELSRRIVESLRLFTIAVSFGGVQSSASLPCRMSHASIGARERSALGLPEDLVRLSIGLEDADDLIEDLEGALSRVCRRCDAAAAADGGAPEMVGALAGASDQTGGER